MKLRYKSIWQKPFAAIILLTLVSLPAFSQMAATKKASVKVGSLSKTERKLAQKISLDSIKKYTNALSADEMEGRGTMQPGGDKAANWIVTQFKSLGLKPLGDKGSYLQSINFKETILTAEFEVGTNKFKNGEDFGFVPLPFEKNDSNITGDMVFAGYGLSAVKTSSDPASKIGIREKVVVIINGPPKSISKEKWNKANSNMLVVQSLIIGGAKAVVIVGNGREGDKTEEYIDYFARRQVALADKKSMATPFPIPPIMMITQATAEKLFVKAGTTYKDAREKAESNDFKSIALNQKAKVSATYKSKLGKSSNVVAYIEGSDPTLKEQAVLFSAHYDAYGVENGQIYNGAADNALGTAEMLSVAEAFSKMKKKPKRSMIFLAVTGEEYGLYGSKYWANNPTWDLSKIAGNLNLDGIGTEVYGPVKNMVGFGAEHSTLGAMLEDVAKSYGVKLMPDPQPEERVFTRSDHYSFVQKGVPALMLMGAPEGTKEEIVSKIKAWEKVNYHQPTDDVMKDWHWEGAKTVADMMGILGLRISNQTKAPEWLPTSKYSKIKR